MRQFEVTVAFEFLLASFLVSGLVSGSLIGVFVFTNGEFVF